MTDDDIRIRIHNTDNNIVENTHTEEYISQIQFNPQTSVESLFSILYMSNFINNIFEDAELEAALEESAENYKTMEKKDIKTRKDIYKLVSTFYAKVRVDDTLAFFFDQNSVSKVGKNCPITWLTEMTLGSPSIKYSCFSALKAIRSSLG